MEQDYKEFRRYVKEIDKTSLKKLCRLAGFNDHEMLFIVPFFSCGKSEDYIADMLCLSVDAYHKAKKKYVRRLQYFCHQIYHTTSDYTELRRKLDEYIHQN